MSTSRTASGRQSRSVARRVLDAFTVNAPSDEDYLDSFDALDRYPDASHHALAYAGHYLPFEQPETFTGLVHDWLTRSTRSSRAGSARQHR